MPFLNKLLKPYITLVLGLSIVILGYVTIYVPYKWSLPALLFTLAYVALDALTADVAAKNEIFSMGTACMMLILFYFGLIPAIMGGVASMFLMRVTLKRRGIVPVIFNIKLAFNIAQDIVGSFITFNFLRYFQSDLHTFKGLLVVVAASILFITMNTLFIFLAGSFSSGKWMIDNLSLNQLFTECFIIVLTVLTIYIYDGNNILLTFALFSIYIPFRKIAHMNYQLKQQNEALMKDTLTHAYNFKYFEKILQGHIENNKLFSVIFIDLDKFKEVNDNYGHSAGNKAIEEVSRFLQQTAGDNSILCRFGGDEFCVIIEEEELDKTEEIAQRIISQNCKFEVQYGENKFPIGWSVGVYTTNGSKESVQTIIDRADTAMYQAKKQGENSIASI